MEQRTTKNYFQFNKGINTESNEINFPDGYSTDERNYELLVDGSRKRRRGLQQESGGSTLTVSTVSAGAGYNAYKWRNIEGNTSLHFIVHQIGSDLWFADDDETPSDSFNTQQIDLTAYKVSGSTTDAQVAAEPCQFAAGRGVLLVTHKYLKPIYIKWDEDNSEFGVNFVEIQHRDFYGIDDGVANQVQPDQAVFQDYTDLEADHLYNLRNRGWRYADITAFADRNDPSSGDYPSKSMLWYTGYERVADQSTAASTELIGTRSSFDATKIAAELTGMGSAPQGSLLLNPLDTRYTVSVSNDYGDDPEAQISGWTVAGDNQTVTITTATAHGRSTNDFITISGNAFVVEVSLIGTFYLRQSLNGTYQCTVNSATELEITLDSAFVGTLRATDGTFKKWTATLGQINGNPALANSDGEQLSVGPTACAYFAGRAWWAGIESDKYSDTVFFSQIAQKPDTFGDCYQDADPTDPERAQLVDSDGGFIVIPNLGKVQRMLPMRDAILIFTDQGVWEVGGTRRGAFTASNYSVRKVTESECSSSRSPRVIGNRAIYTGPRGIHILAPNPYTSVLEEASLSDELIQSLWNDIPVAQQKRVFTAYDDALDRFYFLYDDGTATTSHIYQFCLVLDLRIGAYFKYQFNEGSNQGVAGIYTVTDADSSNSNKKVKFIVQQSTTTVDICDLNQTDYEDFDGAESPLPYVTTGWDNVGDFQRRKQAPVITVYAKRTETGYTDNGTGYDAVNESSNLLTAYWDWTDDSVSGKIGSQNETYRHVRGFLPASASDVDGYPVVVTRNKVRGRGRVLQLRFDGATGKDSHILGFTTNYKITRRV